MYLPFDTDFLAPYLAQLHQFKLGQVLYSVFVSGDASPETCMVVMSICAAILFVLIGMPRLKLGRDDVEGEDTPFKNRRMQGA